MIQTKNYNTTDTERIIEIVKNELKKWWKRNKIEMLIIYLKKIDLTKSQPVQLYQDIITGIKSSNEGIDKMNKLSDHKFSDIILFNVLICFKKDKQFQILLLQFEQTKLNKKGMKASLSQISYIFDVINHYDQITQIKGREAIIPLMSCYLRFNIIATILKDQIMFCCCKAEIIRSLKGK